MEYVITLIIAAGLAFIPANIAKSKGHSFGLWWFYGWMIFIVAVIHVHFISDKNASKEPNMGDGPYTPSAQISSQSAADELTKYKELFDQGVLTEEEFNAKKAELLKFM